MTIQPSTIKRKRPNPHKRAIIKKIVIVSVIILLLIALAVFNFFLPFRTLLPAYEISRRGADELRLHFLSVGQGDCTVVEFPDGELLIVDSGDGSFASRNHIVRYVKALDRSKISYLLTHTDFDHVGGMEELISLFGGETLYLPAVPCEEGNYVDLLDTAQEKGLKTASCPRYTTIANESGAYLCSLSPLPSEREGGNELSTVLYLSYGGVRALLSGDINAEREKKLLEEYQTDETFFDREEFTVRLSEIEILKVAHHGSAYSSDEEWLKLLRTETAILSCGAGNWYSHPSMQTMETLTAQNQECNLYRTDELGDIMVTIKDGTYTVRYGESE